MGSDQDPCGPTSQGCAPDTSQEDRGGWSVLWGRHNVSSVTASPLSHCPLGTSGLSPPQPQEAEPLLETEERDTEGRALGLGGDSPMT